MWILMNDSMLSVVRHNTLPATLLVRARLAGDIEQVFPSASVVENGGSDYRFRASVPEHEVAAAVSRRVLDIDYGNFKSSVPEPKRHHAYFKVWDVLHRMQEAARKCS